MGGSMVHKIKFTTNLCMAHNRSPLPHPIVGLWFVDQETRRLFKSLSSPLKEMSRDKLQLPESAAGHRCFEAFSKPRGLYNVKPFSTDISVKVAEIQKFQKTKCIYFRILVLSGPPPSQLVPKPFNWFPTHSTGPQTMFLLQVSQ